MIIAAPVGDFLDYQDHIRKILILIAVVIFLIAIPVIYLISRSFSGFLGILADDAGRIMNFDYGGKLPVHSVILEFNKLSNAFGVMKETLSEKTAALETASDKLKHIIDLGIAMSIERDPDSFLR